MNQKKNPMLTAAVLIGSAWLASGSAWAKLPAPSDEAKAKAAETAAKTTHAGQVDAFKLCKSMDATAAAYHAGAKKAGRETKPAVATPPCVDPGPFVYTPPAPPPVAMAAPAAMPAAVPAGVPAAAAPTMPMAAPGSSAPAMAGAPKK